MEVAVDLLMLVMESPVKFVLQGIQAREVLLPVIHVRQGRFQLTQVAHHVLRVNRDHTQGTKVVLPVICVLRDRFQVKTAVMFALYVHQGRFLTKVAHHVLHAKRGMEVFLVGPVKNVMNISIIL